MMSSKKKPDWTTSEAQRIDQNSKATVSMPKKGVGGGTAPNTALITQDFLQIQYEKGFVQNLIICISTKSNGKNGLNRVYRHFVGKSRDKNDIAFVIGA